MAASSEAALFVDAVARSVHGRVWLANALDSVREGLVDDAFVKGLLEELVERCGAEPARWATERDSLCSGHCTPAARRDYLRAADPAADVADADASLATVYSLTVFLDYQLDSERLKAELHETVTFPPLGIETTRKDIDRVLKLDRWYKPPTPDGGAWLGRPPSKRGNCWISTTSMPGSSADAEPADAGQLCESIGIEPVAGAWYLRAVFSAAEASVPVHRPTFSDMGNRWFRVRSALPRGRRYASLGWGATLHIGALRVNDADDVGAPERVCGAVPVSSLGTLSMQVFEPRADEPSPLDPDNYESRMNLESQADLVRKVLALWDAEP